MIEVNKLDNKVIKRSMIRFSYLIYVFFFFQKTIVNIEGGSLNS